MVHIAYLIIAVIFYLTNRNKKKITEEIVLNKLPMIKKFIKKLIERKKEMNSSKKIFLKKLVLI